MPINKRSWRCLVLGLVVCLLLAGIPVQATAATVTKTAKTYDIAVAYDNSGSMYDNSAWCHAKYAMEIFASMLDYGNGDKLTVFPMWEVTTDGSTPSASRSQESTSAISVQSTADIDKLANMYTPYPSGTPFTPVTKAYNYLKSSSASQKWLIVLTDGAFNSMSLDKTRSELKKMSGNSIKVQYLAIGSGYGIRADEADHLYASSVKTANELQTELIGICNKIFQRDELKNRLSGNALKLDISMRKLIVFAQGKNATVTALKDANGTTIPVTMNSGQRSSAKYPEKLSTLDTSLAGQVVTFGACPAGDYTLEYSNADKIQIFYEPDVDMKVSLVNSDGEEEDFTDGTITAGEYTYNVQLTDAVTGEDITNSDLMGGNVNVSTTFTYDGKPPITVQNGGKVTLEEGDNVKVDVVGTYLQDYTISNSDDNTIFPVSLNIEPDKMELSITATVEQPNAWYTLYEHDEWKPIRLDLKLDGQPLSDLQMAVTVLTIQPDNPIPYRTEILKGQSAVNIYIGQDANGQYVEPETGDYKLTVNGVTPVEFFEPASGTATAEFAVRAEPIWLWWILIVIAIAIIVILCGIPVKPKIVYLDFGPGKRRAIKPRRKLSPMRFLRNGQTAFSAKTSVPLTWWFGNSWIKNIFRSRSMSCRLSDIRMENVQRLKIDNVACNPEDPIDISDGSTISWREVHPNGDVRNMHGTIGINRKPQ